MTIGLVVEAAVLVGVKLFDDERASLVSHIARTDDRLALLPGVVRKRRNPVVDDDG